jgi:hypothetical protein
MVECMDKKRVAVVGSRVGVPKEKVFEILDKMKDEIGTIVSGGAAGVDTFAEEWAVKNSIVITHHKPDYSSYGRAAPLLRNWYIAADCDMMIAFPGPTAPGTRHAIGCAKKIGKPVTVCEW